MTNVEFAKLVKDMRMAQSRYFKTRTKEALEKSILLEQKVDDEIEKILNPTIQSSLNF